MGQFMCVPGGKLEYGELLKDCVIREIKEETNLEIKDIERIDMIESHNSEEFHDESHFLFFIYKCKFVSGEIKLNDELQEYIWILPQNCPEDANEYVKMQMERFTNNQ